MLVRHYFQIFSIAAPLLILGLSAFWLPALWLLVIVIPIITLGVVDMLQTKQTIRRLYPFLGRFRYMLESVRPEIQQHLIP